MRVEHVLGFETPPETLFCEPTPHHHVQALHRAAGCPINSKRPSSPTPPSTSMPTLRLRPSRIPRIPFCPVSVSTCGTAPLWTTLTPAPALYPSEEVSGMPSPLSHPHELTDSTGDRNSAPATSVARVRGHINPVTVLQQRRCRGPPTATTTDDFSTGAGLQNARVVSGGAQVWRVRVSYERAHTPSAIGLTQRYDICPPVHVLSPG